MKKTITILFLALIYISANAQAPSIQWQKCLGGTSSEEAYSIQQTTDKGFIIGGTIVSTAFTLFVVPLFYLALNEMHFRKSKNQ